MKQKILIFWTGDKDSALCLHLLKQNALYEIVGLLTVFTKETNRVPFHGVSDRLIVEQAKLLGFPLQRVFISEKVTDAEYTLEIQKILGLFAKNGIATLAFGNIGNERNKVFYQKLLSAMKMNAIFPLWGKDHKELMSLFFQSGHKALVTAINKEKLNADFLALEFNQDYLEKLPAAVNFAGVQGEYLTFVIFGPGFKMRVPYSKSIAVDEGPYLVSLIKEP